MRHRLIPLIAVTVACSGTVGTIPSETSSTAPTIATTTTVAPQPTTTAPVLESPLYLRPIDPVTLKDIAGGPRIGVGGSAWTAVSANRRWLALAAFVSPEGGDPRLFLIDTESWSWDGPIGVPELEPLQSLAVTDSGTVVWLRGRHDIPSLYELAVGETTPEMLASLGPGLWPLTQPADISHLSDDRLTLLAGEWGEDHGGNVSVIQIGLGSGDRRSLVLPQVWSGGLPPGDEEAETLSPGWVFDHDAGLLYVVPADRNEMIVVDLGNLEIAKRHTWSTGETWLDRVLAFWMPGAYAKTENYSNRRLALSPDGSMLYVVTERAGQSLGLEVLDTDTFEPTMQSDLAVWDVAAAPDGESLLASGAGEGEDQGLYVLDRDTLEVRTHILPEMNLNLDGFSPDGSHAYVWSFNSEANAMLYVSIELENPRAVAWRKVTWPGRAVGPAAALIAAR